MYQGLNDSIFGVQTGTAFACRSGLQRFFSRVTTLTFQRFKDFLSFRHESRSVDVGISMEI